MTSIVGPIITNGTTTTEVVWKRDSNGDLVRDENGQPIPIRVYEKDYSKKDVNGLGHPKKGAKPKQTRTLRYDDKGKVIGGAIIGPEKDEFGNPIIKYREYHFDREGNITGYTDTWTVGINPPIERKEKFKYPSGKKIP